MTYVVSCTCSALWLPCQLNMHRHIDLCSQRYLVDMVTPGVGLHTRLSKERSHKSAETKVARRRERPDSSIPTDKIPQVEGVPMFFSPEYSHLHPSLSSSFHFSYQMETRQGSKLPCVLLPHSSGDLANQGMPSTICGSTRSVCVLKVWEIDG